MTELQFVGCQLPQAEAELFYERTHGSVQEVIAYLIRQVNSGRIEPEEYRNELGGDCYG